MSNYYFHHKYHLGYINIAKNSSTSITPYLIQAGFKNIQPEDIPTDIEDLPFFYILRNPIDRFCSGIVETYCNSADSWGTSKTEHALFDMSDSSQQEFCFNLLMRLVPWNSKKRLPEGNIPVNEGLGYEYDVHTELQTASLGDTQNRGIARVVPISIRLTSEIPQIFFEQTKHSSKQSLLTTPVKHLNQSLDGKKRMNDNMKAIVVANRENACMQNIWHYLKPDIDHWNYNIQLRYMQQYHMNEKI